MNQNYLNEVLQEMKLEWTDESLSKKLKEAKEVVLIGEYKKCLVIYNPKIKQIVFQKVTI